MRREYFNIQFFVVVSTIKLIFIPLLNIRWDIILSDMTLDLFERKAKNWRIFVDKDRRHSYIHIMQ